MKMRLILALLISLSPLSFSFALETDPQRFPDEGHLETHKEKVQFQRKMFPVNNEVQKEEIQHDD